MSARRSTDRAVRRGSGSHRASDEPPLHVPTADVAPRPRRCARGRSFNMARWSSAASRRRGAVRHRHRELGFSFFVRTPTRVRLQRVRCPRDRRVGPRGAGRPLQAGGAGAPNRSPNRDRRAAHRRETMRAHRASAPDVGDVERRLERGPRPRIPGQRPVPRAVRVLREARAGRHRRRPRRQSPGAGGCGGGRRAPSRLANDRRHHYGEDTPIDGRTAWQDRNRDLVLDACSALRRQPVRPRADVAARSGVSRSVYRYYEDFDELVRARSPGMRSARRSSRCPIRGRVRSTSGSLGSSHRNPLCGVRRWRRLPWCGHRPIGSYPSRSSSSGSG